MHERRLPSARRVGATRQAPIDYSSVYCSKCGRIGFAARCSACAAIVCVDWGSCHTRHYPREYIAMPIGVKLPGRRAR